jgi:hypothetical protein
MITAKLPPELRDDAPRKISEMRLGEIAHVLFTDFNVSENGDCFLNAAAELRKKLFSTVEVRRVDAGFHVIVPANTKYKPGAIPLVGEKLPVASVTVGPEA